MKITPANFNVEIELDNIPDDHQWVVQDRNGEIWSFINKPNCDSPATWENTGLVGRGAHRQWYESYNKVYNPNWKESLNEISVLRGIAVSEENTAQKWIPYNGGGCPVLKGMHVDVRYRDGTEAYSLPALQFKNDVSGSDASYEYWMHDGMDKDIIAYRLSTTLPSRTEWDLNTHKEFLAFVKERYEGVVDDFEQLKTEKERETEAAILLLQGKGYVIVPPEQAE